MKALTRNTLLALPLALLLVALLPRHGTFGWDFLDAFTLAFSFTYVGHLVEVVLLKIPGIETPAGKFVRVLGWFAGGLWCYELGRWLLLLYGRNTSELPPLLWGGSFLWAWSSSCTDCYRRPANRTSTAASSRRPRRRPFVRRNPRSSHHAFPDEIRARGERRAHGVRAWRAVSSWRVRAQRAAESRRPHSADVQSRPRLEPGVAAGRQRHRLHRREIGPCRSRSLSRVPPGGGWRDFSLRLPHHRS